MKKIVLAFDSFKGSVGSFEIAKAAEKAIQEELPDCQIIRFPIADGGEGTTEALCSALHAQTVSCRVHDPFMKPIEVSYGIVNNGAMAIIEMASACGLPVVVTRVGGLPEVVLNGETGLVVERENPVALAAALRLLVLDPERRRLLGQRGREHVSGMYEWKACVERMIDVYRNLSGPI